MESICVGRHPVFGTVAARRDAESGNRPCRDVRRAERTAATVLAHFNGGDAFTFWITSDGLFGARRRFRSFSEAAAEAGMSRIYGGIHFRSANLEGQPAGRRVGEFVARNLLVPFAEARLEVRREGAQALLQCPHGYSLQAASSLGGPEWHELAGEPRLRVLLEGRERYFDWLGCPVMPIRRRREEPRRIGPRLRPSPDIS
jgi:hypothetical protein